MFLVVVVVSREKTWGSSWYNKGYTATINLDGKAMVPRLLGTTMTATANRQQATIRFHDERFSEARNRDHTRKAPRMMTN